MSCGGTGQVWAPDPVPPGPGGPNPGEPPGPGKPQKVVVPPLIEQGSITNYEGPKFLFMRHGLGKATHENGFVYEGRWRFGKWSGKGTLTWPDNWTYSGGFSAGMLSGKGRLELVNDIVFEGRFSRSYPKGKGAAHFPNGARIEGRWADCETAKIKLFDSDGKPMKARLVEGNIQTKKGMFSKWETLADFNLRTILVAGVAT